MTILPACLLYAALAITGSARMEFSTCLYDSSRQRPIPVAVYRPDAVNEQTRVLVFNHGYDQNKNPESYRSYDYLTRFLADKGYYVISIQHELPGDPPLAMDGNLMKTRLPNWSRGVENILFVVREFKKLNPGLDWNGLVMMGHSNGGDMTMLLAAGHPELIARAISLDHRRMIMPRTGKPRLDTLRACDCEADPGVIPTKDEQLKYRTTVIRLEGVAHSDMGKRGTDEQHECITKHIAAFLDE